MPKQAKPIPEGFYSLTPHLIVRNAAKMIEFYKKAFGAVELNRAHAPDGKTIMHALLRIGNSNFMINDEFPDMKCLSPLSYEGVGSCLALYVEDVDKVFQQALEAGATVEMPVQDQFWGDRYGQLKDPSGHHWEIATHKEDLTSDEIAARMCNEMAPAK